MIERRIKNLFPENIRGNTVIGELPSAPDNVIAILLYDGTVNTEYFACGTIYNPVIKVVLRNQSYEQAKQWVEYVKDSLHKYTDEYFMSILLQGYPMYLGKDAQKLHEFQIVFNIQVKE